MGLGSLAVAAALAGALWFVSPLCAVALGTGTMCGLCNALLSMRSNERLADHRRSAIFVISSMLRIVVFGIVPVEFAVHGPAWTMLAYFVGFFTPLGLYTMLVARALRTE